MTVTHVPGLFCYLCPWLLRESADHDVIAVRIAYLRMLLTHGARSVLNAASMARQMKRALDPLRLWALGLAQRSHHNKAACALANKLAHICFAVLRDQEPYAARTLIAKAA